MGSSFEASSAFGWRPLRSMRLCRSDLYRESSSSECKNGFLRRSPVLVFWRAWPSEDDEYGAEAFLAEGESMGLGWLSLEDLRRRGKDLRYSSRGPDAECDLYRSCILIDEGAESSRLNGVSSDLWESTNRWWLPWLKLCWKALWKSCSDNGGVPET